MVWADRFRLDVANPDAKEQIDQFQHKLLLKCPVNAWRKIRAD
jgi:hypothetical protein